MKKGMEIMKKTLAILLSVLMVVCMMPGMAFAETILLTDSNTKVEISAAKFIFNGAAQKPTITVTYTKDADTKVKLEENTDFTVSYSRDTVVSPTNSNPDLTSAGTIKIEIEGTGKYSGKLKAQSYIIEQKTLALDMVSIPAQEIGSTLKNNDIQVKDGAMTLTENTDYKITSVIAETKKDGNNSVTIEGIGNYKGIINKSYLGANLLNTDKYEIEIGNYSHPTYNGQPQSISTSLIKVKKKNKASTEYLSTTYYGISFRNNINAGNATVVVTGKNGYVGNITANYVIDQKPITLCSISSPENWAPGETVDVAIKDGTKSLQKGVDYDINTDNISNGVIDVYGIGNYGGAKTLTVRTGSPISYASVTMLPNLFTYTGSACMPDITVKLYSSDKPLIKNTDYKVVYEKNINAGTAIVKIIGIGDYAGTIKKTFTILQKVLTTVDTTLTLSSDSVYYNGKDQTPTTTVRCAGRTLTKDVDYTVSYYNNKTIGTATVYVYGKGNYSGSISKTFKILGKDISSMNATLSTNSYNYDGMEKKPTVTLYDGTIKLSNYNDYTVAYKDNRYSGTATVTITGKGNYSGTKTLTFNIVGKDQKITTGKTEYTKYLTSDDFNLNAKATGDGTGFTYISSNPSVATVSATGRVTIVGTGSTTIKVSTVGEKQYNPTYKNIYVYVAPKKPVITTTSPVRGQLKVRITKVKGATKYQIRYGRAGNYKYSYATHIDSSYKTQFKTMKKLTRGKYYVKVRAYKTEANGNKVYGNWSATKKVYVR